MAGHGDLTDVPILDSPSGGDLAHAVEVALLDLRGMIVRTNAAWDDFCSANAGDLARAGVGASYLDACAAGGDDPAAREVADAIHCALRGDLPAPMSILVPCDSPAEPRVFHTLVSSRLDDDGRCIGATVTLSRVPAEASISAPADASLRGWTPDVLPALLRVAEIVPEETTLAQTLRRLAESARDLLGVSYAAVSIAGLGGAIDELAHAGIDAQSVQPLNSPAAVIGWLQGQRHFLSRDVLLSGRRLATLYVAQGVSGWLSSRAESVADSFIEAGGTAIENAQTYQASQRGHRWADAAAALTQELAGGEGPPPLEAVLRSAARAADADLAALVVPEDNDTLCLHAIVGGREDVKPGMLFPRDTAPAGEVIRTGKPLLLEHRPAQVDAVSDRPMGPVAVVPLTFDGKVFGALVVSRLDERPPFNSSDVDALLGFSKAAGVALDIHRAVADRGHLQVHDDRARIAHELHDQVVRQLFAVGMGLEGIIESLHDPELRGRVAGYVAALDESIRGIRETVYRMGDG